MADYNSTYTGVQIDANLALAATAVQPAAIAKMVVSDTTGITGADAIANVVSLTQAEYDALTPDADTLYVVI